MVEMWNRRMELGLLFCVAQVFRHLHPGHGAARGAAGGGLGRGQQAEDPGDSCSYLDEELGKRRYVAGTDYSVADITALVAVDFMKPARMQRPEGLRNLARWHAEVSARPSAKA